MLTKLYNTLIKYRKVEVNFYVFKKYNEQFTVLQRLIILSSDDFGKVSRKLYYNHISIKLSCLYTILILCYTYQ